MRQFYNNFEHPTNTILMTFLVDKNIKEEYKRACKRMGTNMTAELNKFLRDYIKSAEKEVNTNQTIYGDAIDKFFSDDDF